jgi:hypothetical protein
MTNDRVELMLDNLYRAQDRLIFYLSIGFVSGFTIGVLTAWLLIVLGK